VYGYLHDDASLAYPTPWLAAQLFAWPEPVAPSRDSALLRWHFAQPLDGLPNPDGIASPWSADPQAANWLMQREWRDPALGEAIALVQPDHAAAMDPLYAEQLDAMRSFVGALEGPINGTARRLSAPVEIELIAPRGSGKRTLATELSAALGVNLLIADADELLGRGVSFSLGCKRIARAVRLSRMLGALLYWHDAGAADPALWRGAPHAAITILGVEKPLAHASSIGAARKSLALPALLRAQRVSLWNRVADSPAPAPIVEWSLNPAEIGAAALAAPAGSSAVIETCKRLLYKAPGELFMPLPCPFEWKDIVLADHVSIHLAELETQAHLRGEVYEDWGFARLCPLGKGISALFAGPSGTGKTMAAQVIARSLDMELYRVDLSGVVNKYIGETEKRLKQVFDACERANVVLFFDEADALFGQRTQVKDAHDRFANIEIDYLLQRMEQFNGIAILATNRKSDLDQAFMRRLRFIIDFLPPGPRERKRLWELALPGVSPKGEPLLDDIDFELLANRLDMTGADIKNAALAAAFLARRDRSRITMAHVLHATTREMSKHGTALRADEWHEARDA